MPTPFDIRSVTACGSACCHTELLHLQNILSWIFVRLEWLYSTIPSYSEPSTPPYIHQSRSSMLKPGYTIEAGIGQNPLPISQFNEIYQDNLGILILGMVL